MDLRETAGERRFRAEARAWLAANVPTGPPPGGHDPLRARFEFRQRWHRTLWSAGWMGLTWPTQWGGRGLSLKEHLIFSEEAAWAQAPPIADWVGVELTGPTLMRWGTPAQQARHLPRILEGAEVWCQGFSEAEAGSDLAAVSTTATRRGDGWVVEGRKRWTSWARFADYCLVLARTGDPAARHRTVSCFVVPMDAPGVAVEPIRMSDGEAEENEVAFDAVRVDGDALVGEVDGGWPVLMTNLSLARGPGTIARAFALEALVARLPAGGADVPVLRAAVTALRYLGYRKLGELEAGQDAGPVASLEKLVWAELSQEATRLGLDGLGPEGIWPAAGAEGEGEAAGEGEGERHGERHGEAAAWHKELFRALANSVEGGTDEIQRNTVAARVLGLRVQ